MLSARDKRLMERAAERVRSNNSTEFSRAEVRPPPKVPAVYDEYSFASSNPVRVDKNDVYWELPTTSAARGRGEFFEAMVREEMEKLKYGVSGGKMTPPGVDFDSSGMYHSKNDGANRPATSPQAGFRSARGAVAANYHYDMNNGASVSTTTPAETRAGAETSIT